MEEKVDPEELKNSVIILALDNLASTYEIALEDAKNMPEDEIEYLEFIVNFSRELIKERGGSIYESHTIKRPQWKTK